MCPKRSTLAEPGDDLVEDGRTLRLVVELVAQARVGPPLDAGAPIEDLGRGRRHEAVVEPVQDEGRAADRTRSPSAPVPVR